MRPNIGASRKFSAPGCLVYTVYSGLYYPVNMWIINDHNTIIISYKDPYETTSVSWKETSPLGIKVAAARLVAVGRGALRSCLR